MISEKPFFFLSFCPKGWIIADVNWKFDCSLKMIHEIKYEYYKNCSLVLFHFFLTKKKNWDWMNEWIKGFKANLILKRMALLHLRICLHSLSLSSSPFNGNWVERKEKKKVFSLFSLLFTLLYSSFSLTLHFFPPFETLDFNCTWIFSVFF